MAEQKHVQQLPIPEREGFMAIFDGSYLEDIPKQLASWKLSKVLLVYSKSLDSTTSFIKDLERRLGNIVISKKCGIGQHSPYADVIDIAHRIQKLDIDAVVSIGSGSYNDACQSARLLAATLPHDFTEDDMEALIDQKRGAANEKEGIKNPSCKLIVVPLSLSAGEWNSISSATNSAGKKQHFGHPAGAADLILLDPKLASTSPANLWLSSGVRAIDHCVETICNPTCPAECADKMERGLQNMIKGLSAYKKGKDLGDDHTLLEGISECQYGARDAMTGYLIYHVPFGPSHAIGHQLGSVGGVMHGMTSCICLAPVLKYTADRNPEAQKRVLRVFNDALGWKKESAGEAVEAFVKELGFPTRLHEVGITEPSQIDEIAEKTLTDVLAGLPGHFTEKQDVMGVLQLAL